MKVLIADDHALFRDGLGMHLEQLYPNMIILQASNFGQALKILEEDNQIDLIVLDLDMPDMSWEAGIAAIRQKAKEARFVVISASEDVRSIRKALNDGASGYIPKRSDPKILSRALQLILDGGTYLPPELLEATLVSENKGEAKPKNKTLTARQMQVLELIAQGLSNKQIAYEMGVSEATVKLHINALLRAIRATNRTQAVINAQKMGLI